MIPLFTHIPNPGDPPAAPEEHRPNYWRWIWPQLVIFGLFLVAQAAQYFRAKPQNSSIFHAPPEGCPAGTTLLKGIFEQKGKRVDGCRNPSGDGSIDELSPGESVQLPIPLTPPPEKPGGGIPRG